MTDNILAGVKTKSIPKDAHAPTPRGPAMARPVTSVGPRVVENYGHQNDAGDVPTKGLYRNGILQTGKPRKMR